jgi:hypothetical protein
MLRVKYDNMPFFNLCLEIKDVEEAIDFLKKQEESLDPLRFSDGLAR